MVKNPAPVRPPTVGRLLLSLAVAALPMAGAIAARTSPADGPLRSGDRKHVQGQESLVAESNRTTEKRQPAVATLSDTESPAKEQKREERRDETWRIHLKLEVSKVLPSAVQWAVFDKDPVPGFKARFNKFQGIYREQVKLARTEVAREKMRKGWLAVQWDWGFKEIPGDHLYLLTADDPHPLRSNAPDGKKWIVTKVRMTGGNPVCWSIPVKVKYGEAIKVTLTEKNVYDLKSAAQGALREAAVSPEKNKIEKYFRKTWRIQLSLRVSGSVAFEVPYAVFDEDPVPGFKAAVKKWRTSNRSGDNWEKGRVKGDERQGAMAAHWNEVFKKIPGNRLYQLKSSGSTTIASNTSDGKKWIVTKVVQNKGKPVCWCLPVTVKTGKQIKVTLTNKNVFDLGSVFDSVVRESDSRK